MRKAALVLALALAVPLTYAGPVTVARPHIIYREQNAVAAACKGDKLACTTISTEFFCNCELAKGSWVLAPRIIATPTVYSTDDRLLRHELGHLSDVKRSLNEYAASLLLRSFPTGQACNDFVAGEARSFSSTMKSIERATTIRRDGMQYASQPAP